MQESIFYNTQTPTLLKQISNLDNSLSTAFELLNENKKKFQTIKEIKMNSKEMYIQNIEDIQHVCLQDLTRLQNQMKRKQMVTKAEFDRIVQKIQSIKIEQEHTRGKFQELQLRLNHLAQQIGETPDI